MKRTLQTAAAALAIALAGVSASAQEASQLAASAGLTAAEARSMTLSEIFAAKANRGASFDERQVVVSSRSATMAGDPATRQLIAQTSLSFGEAASLSLNEIAAIKFNRGSRTDQRQTAPY